jgi:hypothetical protein
VTYADEIRIRLYWFDGRIEELKQPLDPAVHPEIIRRSGEHHIHFAFTGHIDADGFAVYEEHGIAEDPHSRLPGRDH